MKFLKKNADNKKYQYISKVDYIKKSLERYDFLLLCVKALGKNKDITIRYESLFSHGFLREYDSSKNAKNILKHGISFRDIIDDTRTRYLGIEGGIDIFSDKNGNSVVLAEIYSGEFIILISGSSFRLISARFFSNKKDLKAIFSYDLDFLNFIWEEILLKDKSFKEFYEKLNGVTE
ncbi:Uncharacterised protein [Phocoenobacter uteri]|uniref:Uncharacterized protein n=1 Tax=Phocoenobacter uteri TaxID=146806 RepID=A0A379CAR9_9PAST|nr:BrnT family toxin [Phocoenobacter uteri]MDG6882669.1 hypothetical protein [Phocoenobacter uteri]SUB58835.1 Uncharacterised protein [Phocoenobacter uteri]